MNYKYSLFIVVFFIISLTTGAPKNEKETKDDEDFKDEKDTKLEKADDKEDHENILEKEMENNDEKDDDDDEENDAETKHDENNEKSKVDQSKNDGILDDETENGEKEEKKETKHHQMKDRGIADYAKIDTITHFSLELFRKVAEEERHHSFTLSALPVWKQMLCLLPGAEGDTKKQLQKVLYNGEEDLNIQLFSSKLDEVVKIYSRIYITDDVKLKTEYLPKKRHRRSTDDDDEEEGDDSSEVSNENLEEKIINSDEMIEKVELDSLEDLLEDDFKEGTPGEILKDDKHREKRQHTEESGDLEGTRSKCDYSTLFKQVDFSKVQDANKTINHDFHRVSRGRFRHVLSKGVIDKKTKMLLVNAMDLKTKLMEGFATKHTVKKNFYNYKNEKVGTVNMMTKKSIFPYYFSKSLGASILELPYEHKMSLFVFLPDIIDIDAKNMLTKFKNPVKLMKTLSKMNDTKVEVHLPKFKATGNIHTHLKKALKHMGVTDLFNHEDANLQGFLKDKEDDFSSVGVSQAVRFTVNEKGSSEGDKVKGSTIKFICNRPFAFMVIDKETGHPILTGEFNSPEDIHL